MNENEILTETAVGAAENTDDDSAESREPTSGEPTETSEELSEVSEELYAANEEEALFENESGDKRDGDDMTDAERRRMLANPMFLTFAKGKAQSLDELIADFAQMLKLGDGEPKISPIAKSTPTGGASSPDYALSEHQRRIARDAGMSYREYYSFLKSMKTR